MARAFALAALLAAGLVATAAADEGDIYRGHGLAHRGALKYPAGFAHFDYANPAAPKGGAVTLWDFGGFDSLNPFIPRGRPAPGIGLIYDSLLVASADEAFSAYGLLAEEVEMPRDRSWVAFKLRDGARWHDGRPVTAEDVIWTFETLVAEGRPHYARYWANVTGVGETGDGWVRFDFDGPGNRELPLILGQMQVLPRHWYADRDFAASGLEPPLGSGPYRVAEVDAGRSVTYRRVADYWGADLPVNAGFYNFDTLRYVEYLDFNVALEAFKAGEYDFRNENNSKLWATAYEGPAFDDGRIVVAEIPHQRPTGMQAFVFNLRRALFRDARVREAMGYAFDFEWSNANLFYGQYSRTESYFSNSELAASGAPSEAELAFLEPFRDRLAGEVFGEVWRPPSGDGTGNIRRRLRIARTLLEEAGWRIRDGVLRDEAGTPMAFEILLVQPAFERIAQPFVRNLERLGIAATIRTVDASQYTQRRRSFDFDMTVAVFGQSRSPGNEQRNYWGSEAAAIEGSGNLLGLENEVVDALVEEAIYAEDKEAHIAAVRALDRVLLWGRYLIPHWHLRYDRLAWWDKFGRPEITPEDGVVFNAWWIDPHAAARLQAGRAQQGE